MSAQDLPDIGECVLATFRVNEDDHIYHGFLSREDDYEGSIVWCFNYGIPSWSPKAKQWISNGAEYDDEYEVLAWVRLPEPPKKEDA